MTNTIVLDRPQAPDPKAQQPFPGIWAALGWVVLFFVFQAVAAVVAIILALGIEGKLGQPMPVGGDMTGYALPIIWSLVVSELLLLALMWLYIGKPERLAALGLNRWSSFSLGKTLGLAVALIGTALACNYLYSTYAVPDVEVQEQLRKLFASIPQSIPNTVLLFVAVAVIAPLAEELLFRGLLQNALARSIPRFLKWFFKLDPDGDTSRKSSVWLSIVLSATAFGLAHGDFYAMPPLVLMGAAFGVIYHLTGSLRVTILLHMLNNAAALTFS